MSVQFRSMVTLQLVTCIDLMAGPSQRMMHYDSWTNQQGPKRNTVVGSLSSKKGFLPGGSADFSHLYNTWFPLQEDLVSLCLSLCKRPQGDNRWPGPPGARYRVEVNEQNLRLQDVHLGTVASGRTIVFWSDHWWCFYSGYEKEELDGVAKLLMKPLRFFLNLFTILYVIAWIWKNDDWIVGNNSLLVPLVSWVHCWLPSEVVFCPFSFCFSGMVGLRCCDLRVHGARHRGHSGFWILEQSHTHTHDWAHTQTIPHHTWHQEVRSKHIKLFESNSFWLSRWIWKMPSTTLRPIDMRHSLKFRSRKKRSKDMFFETCHGLSAGGCASRFAVREVLFWTCTGQEIGVGELLVAPGIATRNPGIATRSKDATRGSWHYYWTRRLLGTKLTPSTSAAHPRVLLRLGFSCGWQTCGPPWGS